MTDTPKIAEILQYANRCAGSFGSYPPSRGVWVDWFGSPLFMIFVETYTASGSV